MFTPLFVAVAVAVAATPSPDREIVIVNDQPTMTISLQAYSLARPEGLRSIRHRIGYAAKRVCDREYRGVSYLETIACVKGAIAVADAQLSRIKAQKIAGSTMAAAITMAPPPK
jgi:UrcA family protein